MSGSQDQQSTENLEERTEKVRKRRQEENKAKKEKKGRGKKNGQVDKTTLKLRPHSQIELLRHTKLLISILFFLVGTFLKKLERRKYLLKRGPPSPEQQQTPLAGDST